MKKIIYLFLIVHCTLVIDNCLSQWVLVNNGIGNLPVVSLTSSGNNIFAGTSVPYGVFMSTNNGENWTSTSLPGYTVWSLAANGNNIFAGTESNGVFISTNNGTSWTQTSLNNRTVYTLTTNGNNIFAGTESNGVFISTNNGTNWTQTPLNNRTVKSLAINGNDIFAGTLTYGVYKNWIQTSLNYGSVYSLAVNGNNIFAGTDANGVYLSTDNGTNWTQTSLNNITISSLAISGNNIFAGHYNGNGVYLSTNNGTNWTWVGEGFPPISITALCIFNNYIFAGALFFGVYRRPLSELIGINPISNQVPEHYSLSQNYPNPFNPTTKIRFELPKSSFATIVVYDALGREVVTLVNEQLKPGTYEADWSADKIASGVYYYKLTAGGYTETKKMVLMK
jgi:hypothetical protein